MCCFDFLHHHRKWRLRGSETWPSWHPSKQSQPQEQMKRAMHLDPRFNLIFCCLHILGVDMLSKHIVHCGQHDVATYHEAEYLALLCFLYRVGMHMMPTIKRNPIIAEINTSLAASCYARTSLLHLLHHIRKFSQQHTVHTSHRGKHFDSFMWCFDRFDIALALIFTDIAAICFLCNTCWYRHGI